MSHLVSREHCCCERGGCLRGSWLLERGGDESESELQYYSYENEGKGRKNQIVTSGEIMRKVHEVTPSFKRKLGVQWES